MTTEHVLLTVPTKTKSESIEISVIFHEGHSQTWAGDEIEKGYHLHVNAISEKENERRIRPFSGLRRLILESDSYSCDHIAKLDIPSSIISKLAFSVARANDLDISKEGSLMIRDFNANVSASTLVLDQLYPVH